MRTRCTTTQGSLYLSERIETAIARIQTLTPPEGLFVAFSGGKDSIVLLDLVRRAGVPHDSHYHFTTVDAPELVRFIRDQYPDVERHRPEQTMWQLIEENGIPPLRYMRYCCRQLKEGGGAGRVVATGVRAAESRKRAKRRLVEACHNGGKRTLLHPIIDWSEEDVWGYIRERELPYCSLYDEGWTRLGCVMCPNGGPKRMARDAARWPKLANAYRRACRAAYAQRAARGIVMDWADGDAMYEWWLSGATDTRALPDDGEDGEQMDLFGDGGAA
jgi:phosphoadenosine phosphosulfate reductase